MPLETIDQNAKSIDGNRIQNAAGLNLSILNDGLPGLSPAWGKLLAEASAVCLDNQGHTNGVMLIIFGSKEEKRQIFWETKITEQIRNSWQDEIELTEFGACGVAILYQLLIETP